MNKVFSFFKACILITFHRYPKLWEGAAFIKKYYSSSQPTSLKDGIIFMCDGRKLHGGLTDRLLGALTSYKIAKTNKVPFYIYWCHPFDLCKYLVPNKYNWFIDQSSISYNTDESFPVVISQKATTSKLVHYMNGILLRLPQLIKKRQSHYYTNYAPSINSIPELYSELFRPSDYLLSELLPHKKVLGSNYWSFSFRFNQLLGDFKDVIGSPLDTDKAQELINSCIQELQIILSDIPTDYMAFVASDSITFLNRVKGIDPRIYIINGEISHIDQSSENNGSEDKWLKTFIDQHIIMNAERVFLLKTGEMYNSGFPRFASLIGGKQFIYHEF